mgnify:CR=1 FL=1
MTTMELKARKMDLMELLLQLDGQKLAQVEKYIQRLLSDADSPTYKMPAKLLNTLLDKAEANKKNGCYIEEEEMNQFIDSLR